MIRVNEYFSFMKRSLGDTILEFKQKGLFSDTVGMGKKEAIMAVMNSNLIYQKIGGLSLTIKKILPCNQLAVLLEFKHLSKY